MQHPALRQRVHFATMRHPAEEPESSASSRSPDSFNGSDSHRTVRAVFCFSAATSPPPRRFCRRVVAIIIGTATATSQQAQPNSSFGRSPSPRPHYERATAENDTTSSPPPRRLHQERTGNGKHRAKTLPLIRDFPQLFRASPRAWRNVPRQRLRSAHTAASLGAKTPSISRFLPSDLHLCPFLPIFAAIHVRKISHPPSSSGFGLDSSPRPVAAIGGENLSLPRQRGAN